MELCKGLFSGTYDGDGNLIEDGNEEKEDKKEAEFFPGLPMTPVLENLREWLVNPHWREYYQKAPSRRCRTLITLEFWYSETESEAAAEAMNLLEEKLSAEDWDHLYRYCGNNPRKEYIRRRRDLASGRGKNSMPDNPAN